MATITGLTAERMLEIEGESVVDGEVINGELILTKHDGTTINAGPVLGPTGPSGPPGPAGGLIPGEVRLWPGDTLPAPANYGKWVWADGTVYAVATYPKAAAHIAAQWRTFAGASDPGANNFRVPDLRGLVAAGMDAMPGGSRANRMTRAVAITIAARTGEEQHIISVVEMPAHAHVVNSHSHGGNTGWQSNDHSHYTDMGWHTHRQHGDRGAGDYYGGYGGQNYNIWEGTPPESTHIAGQSGGVSSNHYHAVNAEAPGTNNVGSNGAHENVQPTVFVPYIVKLDD